MSNAGRQKRHRKSRENGGLIRREAWLPASTIEAMSKLFPGVRGGIDWGEVANAALKPKPRRNALVYLSPPPGPKPVAADLVVLYDNDELRVFKVPFDPARNRAMTDGINRPGVVQ